MNSFPHEPHTHTVVMNEGPYDCCAHCTGMAQPHHHSTDCDFCVRDRLAHKYRTHAITLEFAVQDPETPVSQESVEAEVCEFLMELVTSPPQVTFEVTDLALTTQGWPEVRFVGSRHDLENIVLQYCGGSQPDVDKLLQYIEEI